MRIRNSLHLAPCRSLIFYSAFTEQKPHCYIPLLSAKPGARGYGAAIVELLVAEATSLVQSCDPDELSEMLLLDVYVANETVSKLYERCGFVTLNPTTPLIDPDEDDAP